MKRCNSLILAVLFASAVPASVVLAENPPSAKDLEAAKKAFQEGKKLHAEKKLLDAIEKFKQSYNLSKNPLLLYNIALTMEEAAQDDLALVYYRKFLSDAPPDAAQRTTVTERVTVLEKKLGIGGGRPDPVATKPSGDSDGAKQVAIKPAGTYGEADFQHQAVDMAPPGKPLDVTAFVPEDSGFTVTLHYRTAGEGKFTAKQMKWRYKELVARIPAPKMIGSTVQYWLEVKDAAGTKIAASGKSTSPNTIELQAGAPARFYPDLTEDDAPTKTDDEPRRTTDGDDDDPLNTKTASRTSDDEPGAGGGGFQLGGESTGAPNGFRDVGSSKFTMAKWTTTGIAVAGLGAGITFYLLAGKQAAALEKDSIVCGLPPCRPFDAYDQDLEAAGKRNQTISNVGLGIGAGMSVVAAYFWYKELTAKKRGEMTVSAGGSSDESTANSWIFAPSVTDGYTGAAASVRF